MDLTFAYRGRSRVLQQRGSLAVSLAPNLRRDRVSFDGTLRQPMRFREAMSAAILSGRRRIPPYGANGGAPGRTGRNWIERADGSQLKIGATAAAWMNIGDTFVIETPGGGGYGKAPSAKDP